MGRAVQFVHRRPFLRGKIIQKFLSFRAIFRDRVSYTKYKGLQARDLQFPCGGWSDIPQCPPAAPLRRTPMSIKKFPLEAAGAAVSREALVQAALQEITQNYREASLSNVARATAFRWHMSASACVPRPAAPTRNCCRSTVWRPPPACCAAATEHPADHYLRRLREHQLFLPPVPRALRPEPP